MPKTKIKILKVLDKHWEKGIFEVKVLASAKGKSYDFTIVLDDEELQNKNLLNHIASKIKEKIEKLLERHELLQKLKKLEGAETEIEIDPNTR